MPLDSARSRHLFPQLEIPLLCAPMAGGPSTPELVAAVSNAGGFGFLATGYLSPHSTLDLIDRTRTLTSRPWGINLFVPNQDPVDYSALEVYRARLLPAAEAAGVSLPHPQRPNPSQPDDDFFEEKVALVLDAHIPVVSFTFGLPPVEVVAQFQKAGITVIASVASLEGAQAAAERGVDALVVQGFGAGGHRATLTHEETPTTLDLTDLVIATRRNISLPIIAAGGISRGSQIAELLALGVTAVQLGTAFLRSEEAGTRQLHRDSLVNPRFVETAVTRAFSGRPARGLRNTFMDAHSAHAPHAYPQVHWLTSPLRNAAAVRGDAEAINLWAGTGFRETLSGPAASILRELWDNTLDAQRLLEDH